MNLLSNAIKFTEQGRVVLTVGCIDGTWDISVEDTGIGIPPHAREFIFDEFRQVDGSSRRKYGGTGLGLAIVQKYVREMNGTVNVQSEMGKGSTFTVSLPLKTDK
jgi:signal transduction histidine kinase